MTNSLQGLSVHRHPSPGWPGQDVCQPNLLSRHCFSQMFTAYNQCDINVHQHRYYPCIGGIGGILLHLTLSSSVDAVACLDAIGIIMCHNIFWFGASVWVQKNGTAMGTPPAPEYAQFHYLAHQLTFVHTYPQRCYYVRYLNDIFWSGLQTLILSKMRLTRPISKHVSIYSEKSSGTLTNV